ncbi:hypothetical protein GCM10023205_06060 [Yinghuangia aomiensis]|uniref:Uncharacterized protein n=1 Tax=Yinghuangia aomiensis TaxID=676205 RepID=A0ABP9GPE3_9ACTN
MARENRGARGPADHRSRRPGGLRKRPRRNRPPTRQGLRRAAYAWAAFTVAICAAGVDSWFAYSGRTRVLHISAQILAALIGTGVALDYWRRSTRAPEAARPAPAHSPPTHGDGAEGG